MSLVDMGEYKNENKEYYWILTAIEILSRYDFAIPIYRKDTNNMRKGIKELLKELEDGNVEIPLKQRDAQVG